MKKIFFVSYLLSNLLMTEESIVIKQRTSVLKQYPCTQCHVGRLSKKIVQSEEKLMSDHRELTIKHFSEATNCYLCHSDTHPNELVMKDGNRAYYDLVPTVCGQCHGLKKADWDLGIHGKQKGSWRDEKLKFTCVECHDPHHPKFPKMKAFPAPLFPLKVDLKGEKHD